MSTKSIGSCPTTRPSPSAGNGRFSRLTLVSLGLISAIGALFLLNMSAVPKLFSPIQVGTSALKHRVVLAPLTRYRANIHHVLLDIVAMYYEQRGVNQVRSASTLLTTEATFIAPKAGGYNHVPGIWNQDQINSWKRVTDAVHTKGSFIYLQLWALGRAAKLDVLRSEDPSFELVSASDVKLSTSEWTPRPLRIDEIKEYTQLYAEAASNAVQAGFDGVEIHGATGYLIHQFLEPSSNKRTDRYGGSIENRSRFGLEVVDAVANAIGASKTGIRLSPWNRFQDMRMDDPIPQYTHFVTSLKDAHPDLAYIHVVEPRVNGSEDIPGGPPKGESNDFIRNIWSPRPLISAGGYNRSIALRVAEKKRDLIAFGRHYISNPDLPKRLRKDIPLHPYNRSTFYTPESPVGYIDQPFAEDEEL